MLLRLGSKARTSAAELHPESGLSSQAKAPRLTEMRPAPTLLRSFFHSEAAVYNILQEPGSALNPIQRSEHECSTFGAQTNIQI